MPMKRHLYPGNWTEISKCIRARAKGRCECLGICGLHHDHRCVEKHGHKAVYARGKIVLTVAHLNHDTMDRREENLKALCQRCHLRLDTPQHVKNAAETRRLKREYDERFQMRLAV